jgi:hypothetical protein
MSSLDVEGLIARLSGPLDPADRPAFRHAAEVALAASECWGEGSAYRVVTGALELGEPSGAQSGHDRRQSPAPAHRATGMANIGSTSSALAAKDGDSCTAGCMTSFGAGFSLPRPNVPTHQARTRLRAGSRTRRLSRCGRRWRWPQRDDHRTKVALGVIPCACAGRRRRAPRSRLLLPRRATVGRLTEHSKTDITFYSGRRPSRALGLRRRVSLVNAGLGDSLQLATLQSAPSSSQHA